MVGRSSLASVPFSTLETSNSFVSLYPSLYICIGFDLSDFGSIFPLFFRKQIAIKNGFRSCYEVLLVFLFFGKLGDVAMLKPFEYYECYIDC